MKPSREEDFAKRGAFPSCPTENGLIFVPLIFELPLASQLQGVDVILHKVTDEIISIDTNSSFNFPKGISFTTGMSELQRFLQENSDFCIVDPFSSIYPLLDRLQIQQILLGLQDFGAQCSCRLRAPHFLKVDNFNDPNLGKQLLEAKLNFPVIVKPQVACGVADAHNMALVFKYEDFANLGVPLPAILQEYVDHCSTIFKFYVLGDKVFHAVKKSMPNACVLLSLSEKTGSAPLLFNSLKTLPVAREEQLPIGTSKAIKESLDVGLIENAANWLRERLGLTIFGFDVVIQEGSGDHVIVDLNYLPSFKEVPDSDALPAFWDAIRKKYELAKLSVESLSIFLFWNDDGFEENDEEGRGRRISGRGRPTTTEEDESLVLFGEMVRREKEGNLSLLDPISIEFERIQGGHNLYKFPSAKRDFLAAAAAAAAAAEPEKNDYDW
uniref:Inositol-tetrakisphosphate 1-kinase 6 n=1 Tax=Ananas comosus var. bracteatus TaxID=296719 RepID=A0A6V7Q7Q7_ANACO|nr:unnamed protein product [Ananas comosus var. bracteatus]